MFVLLLLILTLLPATLGHAAPGNEWIIAAMRLSEEPNYQWTAAVNDNARAYVVDGRVLAGGYAWVHLPLVESIALRLPPTRDETIEAVFKGRRGVVLTPGGWKTLRELPRRDEAWSHDNVRPYIRMFNAGNLLTHEGQRPYSNAQFAVNRPHEELAIIVSCYHELKIAGREVSGVLSNIGAQLLLVSDGQEHIRPVIAAGRFKLWLGGGRVEKYQLELEGVLLVDGQACLVIKPP